METLTLSSQAANNNVAAAQDGERYVKRNTPGQKNKHLGKEKRQRSHT